MSKKALQFLYGSLVEPRAWHTGGVGFVCIDLKGFNMIENVGQSNLEMTQSPKSASREAG